MSSEENKAKKSLSLLFHKTLLRLLDLVVEIYLNTSIWIAQFLFTFITSSTLYLNFRNPIFWQFHFSLYSLWYFVCVSFKWGTKRYYISKKCALVVDWGV